MSLTGLVLAAGASSRMGRSKALLRAGPGGQTFLARIVRTLADAGLQDVVVVGRASDGLLREMVEQFGAPARYVVNPLPERGQLSSMITGLDAAEAAGADAVVVVPVDMPLVRAETVEAAVRALLDSAAPIVRVTFDGRHGHPVIFRRELFDELRRADPAVGARAVVRAHAGRVLDLPVDDPGVLKDFDLPREYREEFGDSG